MLLLYIIWDDWPIFMISGSNEQLRQQLEYTQLLLLFLLLLLLSFFIHLFTIYFFN